MIPLLIFHELPEVELSKKFLKKETHSNIDKKDHELLEDEREEVR